MENLTKISNINAAIKYMKEKIILISYPMNIRTIFRFIDNKIQCVNENSSFYLNEYEFKDLYENNEFFIYKPDDELIDDDKDKEYYGWGKLSK